MFDFSTITEVRLAYGAHKTPAEGMCAMEMVAWFNGEPHSDRPKCTSPVLAAYVRVLNDNMPDDVRDRLLKPMLPHLVGTVSPEHEQARAESLLWFVLRNQVPVALKAEGLVNEAEILLAASMLTDARDAAGAARVAAPCGAARSAAQSVQCGAATCGDPALAAAYSAIYSAADVVAYSAADAAIYSAADAGWEPAIQALREAIDIVPQSFGFAADPVERHAALRELDTVK